jgi:hypothetical protein
MNKGMTVLEMKQVSLLLLQPTTMHDRRSSAESFVVASGSGGRPLLHHPRRPSGHSLIDGHVDKPLPISSNSGGGDSRAATMARRMNNASVAKPTWHKQEGEAEKKEREGKGDGEDGRTRKFQDNVDSKAINCNKDNSNRSDNNDQSDGQKRQQQQSKDGGKEASWTDVYEYWNWPPSRATPRRRKRTTFLKMKQVSSLSLQLMTMHDRQSSTELFVAVGVGGGRPFLSHHARRPSGHSLINGHIDEQERVIAEQRVCNKEAARMKEQQAVEQRTGAEETTRMKERQEVESIATEERARDKEMLG